MNWNIRERNVNLSVIFVPSMFSVTARCKPPAANSSKSELNLPTDIISLSKKNSNCFHWKKTPWSSNKTNLVVLKDPCFFIHRYEFPFVSYVAFSLSSLHFRLLIFLSICTLTSSQVLSSLPFLLSLRHHCRDVGSQGRSYRGQLVPGRWEVHVLSRKWYQWLSAKGLGKNRATTSNKKQQ